uniref:NADH-ubiquinone oxidoreductase chain 2 n=1 Tax=Nuttallochiton mirandus TaxID=256062 RepID=A0A6H1PGM9_NULMI|nr:NADH dehydrogenase subunit 2 [Nuttallochiton mirandus]
MIYFPFVGVFVMIMVFGTVLSLSSIHWFGVWFGLELNLLGMIPIMVQKGGSEETESGVKYFLIQAVGSVMFLLGIFLLGWVNTGWNLNSNGSYLMMGLFFFGLLIKLGVAPFHFWVPSVVSGVSWGCNLLLLTWQKVAPLLVLCSFLDIFGLLMLFLVFMSSFFGGVGGVNQTSIRSILAYSSILHMGWLMGASMVSINFCFVYFSMYSGVLGCIIAVLWFEESYNNYGFLNIYSWESSGRLFLVFMLLSLGGMPPLLGFFGKWLVLVSLMGQGQILLSLMLVSGSMVSLYYYLVLSFSLILGLEAGFFKKSTFFGLTWVSGAFINLVGLGSFYWLSTLA